jgi:hypothetical protein
MPSGATWLARTPVPAAHAAHPEAALPLTAGSRRARARDHPGGQITNRDYSASHTQHPHIRVTNPSCTVVSILDDSYHMVILLANGGKMSSRHEGVEPEKTSSGDQRRSFLRKAAVTALGGVVATLGLETPALAKASAEPQSAPHIKKPPNAPAYQAYCCTLLYHYCTISQENNCGGAPNSWSWTCCAYVGSSLTRVKCYECYKYQCSNAIFVSSC